ncbi:MAG: DUF2339 domain-containing protein [Sphingobium sp.]|nr:DUF2339 domain-containing protein [Sphingobium sp.]
MILFLGLMILAALLHDTRKRLSALERQLREETPTVLAQTRRSAVIMDSPQQSPWAQPEEDAENTAPATASTPPHTSAPQPSFTPATEQFARATDAAPEPAASASVPPEEVPAPAPALHATSTPEETGKPARLAFSFEDLFGRKLPIWAGGITLLVAAVLLVKYSIDAGLLSPTVRVVLGLLFGGALIGGAELARRRAEIVQDPRISQSLAGAGLGSLYAATLAASNLYGLIGPGTAFAGLAVITGLAMALALRFGAPSAVLGLIGGLVTPAVIQSNAPNVPLLAGYIAVVIGGLTLLSRHQRWMWLGISALIGGAGWSLLMIVMGGLEQLSMLSVGLLILVLGIGLPVLAPDGSKTFAVRGIAAIIAAGQLALLVATGDFAPLSWGLYGLLSIAFVWLTGQVPALRRMMAVPLIAALLLAGFWPEPDLTLFSAVIAGILLIYGGAAFWRLWRPGGGIIEAGLITITALGGQLLSLWHFHIGAPGQGGRFALLSIGFALVPMLAAGLGWAKEQHREDFRFTLLTSAAGLLLVIAAQLGLPGWVLPVSIALIATALLAIAICARDIRLPDSALVFLIFALVSLCANRAHDIEFIRFIMAEPHGLMAQAILRWGIVMLSVGFFAWHHAGSVRGSVLQGVTVVTGYGLAAQIIPAPWLALTAAAVLLILTKWSKRKENLLLLPAMGTIAAIIILWAMGPFTRWLLPALASLAGEPMLANELTEPSVTIRLLLAPMLMAGFALWSLRERLPSRPWMLAMGQIGMLALIGMHLLYKQVFDIGSMEAFIRLGLAERTLWEAALLATGFILWRLSGERVAGLAFACAALAHNLLYSIVLHNPLWSAQAVGALPLANLLLPAFGIAFGAPLLITRLVPEEHVLRLRRPIDILHMLVILLFAYASLRQIFTGSLLTANPVGPAENIGWSVLAIVLAIGFLVWGIMKGLRDWRIASLVLMLLAVGKVFLFDAAGLDGLLRIASFLALGFSLIGIGWLYSRYLKPEAGDQQAGT